MNRRYVLRGLGAGAGVTSLAGCISGFLNCGPGETKVEALQKNPESHDGVVRVKGQVPEIETDHRFVLNDSTAKAKVHFAEQLPKQQMRNASCIVVDGSVMTERTREENQAHLEGLAIYEETYGTA